jgi:hypothetical protein
MNVYNEIPNSDVKKSAKGILGRIYEAGADAMLDELRAKTPVVAITANQEVSLGVCGTFESNVEGRLVFIPDDEPEDIDIKIDDSLPVDTIKLNDMYFRGITTPHKATKIMEDGFFCHYCGEKINKETWTGSNYYSNGSEPKGVHYCNKIRGISY